MRDVEVDEGADERLDRACAELAAARNSDDYDDVVLALIKIAADDVRQVVGEPARGVQCAELLTMASRGVLDSLAAGDRERVIACLLRLSAVVLVWLYDAARPAGQEETWTLPNRALGRAKSPANEN